MSETLVWRVVYGKPMLFVSGVAVGDCYPSRGSDDDVWRVRLWNENRLQGGREKLVLASAGADDPPEATAKQVLEAMWVSARQEAGES
jgi:hypothetical protein